MSFSTNLTQLQISQISTFHRVCFEWNGVRFRRDCGDHKKNKMSAQLPILRHDTLTEHHSKKHDEISVCCDPYLSPKVRSLCVICQPQLRLSLDYYV